MDKLLQTILEPMLDYPEELVINCDETPHKVSYKISVHESDVGRIIGRGGRFIKALRIVVSNADRNASKKVFVDLH